MSKLADIRAGLVTNLSTLKTTYRDMQISACVLSNPTMPTIWVKPTPTVTDYHQVMETMGNPDGQAKWTLTVQAFVSAAGGDIAGQMLLDELLDTSGPHSVKAALEADKTLNGAVEDLIVRSCSSYQEYVVDGGRGAIGGGMSAFGAEWIVEVS